MPVCDAAHTCVAPALSQPVTPAFAALIVTNQAYAAGFQQLAQLHTLTGVPTKVATVEDICAASLFVPSASRGSSPRHRPGDG